jgi:flagellin-like hook-associated protein FlgL
LGTAYKLDMRTSHVRQVLQFTQSSRSFTDMQLGALQSASELVSRMSVLKTMSVDASKNSADLENYDKEFIELQKQLAEISRHKFNGISLFTSVSKSDHALQTVVGEDSKNGYVVSLARNFIKGEFVGASGNALGEIISNTSTEETTSDVKITTKAGATGVNPDGTPLNEGETDLNWTVTGLADSVIRLGGKPGAWFDDSSITGKWIGVKSGGTGDYNYTMSFDLSGTNLDDITITGSASTDNAGSILINGQETGITFPPNQFLSLKSFSLQSNPSGILVDGTTTVPNVLVDGINELTVRVNNSGGPTGMLFNDLEIDGSATSTSTTTVSTGYYPTLSHFSQEEFSEFLEKIADGIAQVGAEQSRLQMINRQLESTVINYESGLGRIIDLDIARESIRLQKNNVLIQAAATMLGKADELSDVALRVMINK